MARPIVVLPEPDSPTRPTTSPCSTVSVTPSTARNAGARPRLGYSMATFAQIDDELLRFGVAVGPDVVIGLEVGRHERTEVGHRMEQLSGVGVPWAS